MRPPLVSPAALPSPSPNCFYRPGINQAAHNRAGKPGGIFTQLELFSSRFSLSQSWVNKKLATQHIDRMSAGSSSSSQRETPWLYETPWLFLRVCLPPCFTDRQTSNICPDIGIQSKLHNIQHIFTVQMSARHDLSCQCTRRSTRSS